MLFNLLEEKNIVEKLTIKNLLNYNKGLRVMLLVQFIYATIFLTVVFLNAISLKITFLPSRCHLSNNNIFLMSTLFCKGRYLNE